MVAEQQLRKWVAGAALIVQKPLLYVSYWIFRLVRRKTTATPQWVVGVDEIAANVHNIGTILSPSIQVSFSKHPFYDYKYDHCIPINKGFLFYLCRVFYGPVLLGYLVNKADSFFYVGANGFLIHEFDGRDFEFAFLKSRNKAIACFFCGSEIRSIRLMEEFSRKHDMDVVTTYQVISRPFLASDYKERLRELLASSADAYASHIFNFPVDQASYIKKSVHPFLYFHPDKYFTRHDEKFAGTKPLRVLHAPSSPLIKGTPLVRAAVKKLKQEGYVFEYTELIGVPNAVVLEKLVLAHIVLNEFYAFVPGQFGIEAMAAHCALMTSADGNIETSLPAGSNQAWFVTRYWEIYDNLKALLDDRHLVKSYADSGHEWAKHNCTYEVSSMRLKTALGLATAEP